MSKPMVAIVGRQNVGKSTLLNRLSGGRRAIVQDEPGTTRDRIYADVTWQGTDFMVVDTGGLELRPGSAVARGVKEQAETAIREANLILFLVDVKDGVTPLDAELADKLRRTGKPILLVANKADNNRLEAQAAEFYQLGLGEPLVISAYHGRGTHDLLDKITPLLPASPSLETATEAIKVAIVGRPNVGKSMLLNTLIGEERAIVADTPGTTHDALDTLFDFNGQNMLLIDTAGIRRRGRLTAGVEKYSVIRALQAIERADIALLVLDATEPVTAQDTHVAGYIQQAFKGVVIIINKWDLVEDKNIPEWNTRIRSRLRFLPYAPILYTSAKDRQGISKILPEVLEVDRERHKRIATAAVNSLVHEAEASHNPPRRGNKRLNILYATQSEVNPPTFVFFVNDPTLIHFSYQRYLENKIRQTYDFTGTPLRFIFKARGERGEQ